MTVQQNEANRAAKQRRAALLREKVRELRERGLTTRQIANQLGLTHAQVTAKAGKP